jgi:phage/plasmid-associated DNA primase
LKINDGRRVKKKGATNSSRKKEAFEICSRKKRLKEMFSIYNTNNSRNLFVKTQMSQQSKKKTRNSRKRRNARNSPQMTLSEPWQMAKLSRLLDIDLFESMYTHIRAQLENMFNENNGDNEFVAPMEPDDVKSIHSKLMGIQAQLKRTQPSAGTIILSDTGVLRRIVSRAKAMANDSASTTLLKVDYRPSNDFREGRFYANTGYQSLPGWLRSYCGAAAHLHDLDLVNAYPSILLMICEKLEINPSVYEPLAYYVRNRKECLEVEVTAARKIEVEVEAKVEVKVEVEIEVKVKAESEIKRASTSNNHNDISENAGHREASSSSAAPVEDTHRSSSLPSSSSCAENVPTKATITEADAKRMYLVVLHNGSIENNYPYHQPTIHLQRFAQAIPNIVQHLIDSSNEYKAHYKRVLANPAKRRNPQGTFISQVIQRHEHDIVARKLVPYLQQHGYRAATLMFDGVMVYSKHRNGLDKFPIDKSTIDKSILRKFAETYNLPSYIRVVEKPFCDVHTMRAVHELIEQYKAMSTSIAEFSDRSLASLVAHQLRGSVAVVDLTGRGKCGGCYQFDEHQTKLWQSVDAKVIRNNIPDLLQPLLEEARYAAVLRIRYTSDKEIVNDESAKASTKVVESAAEMIKEKANDQRKQLIDQVYRKFGPLIKRINSVQLAKNVWEFAQTDASIHDPDFEQHINQCSYLFPLSDGRVVDLRSGHTRAMRKSDYFSVASAATRVGNPAIIDQFVCEMMPNKDDRCYLQTTLGYCLSNEVPDRQFFVWLGSGGNGKSVIAQMFGAVSPFCTSLRREAIAASKRSLESAASNHTAHLIPLKLNRLAIVAETRDSDLLQVGVVKSLTGGDQISIRALCQSEESFVNRCKIIVYTNKRFTYEGEEAMCDRVKYLNFPMRFVDTPEEDHHVQRDSAKVDELLRHHKNEILGWLVQGAVRYYKDGQIIKEPESVQQFTASEQRNADPVQGYLYEECIEDPTGRIAVRDLIDDLYEYDRTQGRFHVRKLATRLRAIVGKDKDGNDRVRRSNNTLFLFGYKERYQME